MYVILSAHAIAHPVKFFIVYEHSLIKLFQHVGICTHFVYIGVKRVLNGTLQSELTLNVSLYRDELKFRRTGTVSRPLKLSTVLTVLLVG